MAWFLPPYVLKPLNKLYTHLSIYVLSAVFHHRGAGFRDHANWRRLGLCVPRASAADNATGERAVNERRVFEQSLLTDLSILLLGNAFHHGLVRQSTRDNPGLGSNPGAPAVLRCGYLARLESLWPCAGVMLPGTVRRTAQRVHDLPHDHKSVQSGLPLCDDQFHQGPRGSHWRHIDCGGHTHGKY